MIKIVRTTAALLACGALLPWAAQAAEIVPPQQIRAFDTLNDGGGSLTVTWAKADGEDKTLKYQILLHEPGTA